MLSRIKYCIPVVNFNSFAFWLLLYAGIGISIKTSAQPGVLGPKTVSTLLDTVNEYTALTANASAGATSITVANANLNTYGHFATSLGANELVMIIQMQGATMTTSDTSSSSWGAIASYNNAGLYEFDQVASISEGTTINLVNALKNSYTASGNVQVIRVPRYSTLTVNSGASITTAAWNGSTGGVIAIEVNSTTTINGTIDASNLGFRGGNAVDSSQCCPQGNDKFYATTIKYDGAEKGESIGGSTTTYDGLGGRYGRGAPANGGGGGNAHNSGGGGGANGNNGVAWNGLGVPDLSGGGSGTPTDWKNAWNLESANFANNNSSGGGKGGYSFSDATAGNPTSNSPGGPIWAGDDRTKMGGYGGQPLNNSSGTRVFMGGGGGAGDENDGSGTSGGNGGGIVYMLVGGIITGSGSINANGQAVSGVAGVDGSGGGGGGGSVDIYTSTAGLGASGITLSATGGTGGTQNLGSGNVQAEGPGGGGGGGVGSATLPAIFNIVTTSGHNGQSSATAVKLFKPNGATEGATGILDTLTLTPYTSPIDLPVSLLGFSAQYINDYVEVNWTTASEINNNFFSVERAASPNPSEGGGLDFDVLGTVKGAGNSTRVVNYSYDDEKPLEGESYYRLSQTDYDGKTQTFAPVAVRSYMKTESNSLISAETVPFSDYLKLNYAVTNAGNVQFRLFNSTGQMVRSEQTLAGKGVNTFSFDDLSSFSSGIYVVMMNTPDNQQFVLKVVKM